MGRKANVYSRVTDADEMIKTLCEKQPEALWCVKPDTIAVLGIENKERSEKSNTLATIKSVRGAEKAIFQMNNISTRYVIVVYWSDWNQWSTNLKAAILFHELMHVHVDFEKTVKHDCEDFRMILDKFGVDWAKKGDKLPNLLSDEVKFDINLRPVVEEYDEETNDEIEEDDNKPKKKSKKELKDEQKKAEQDDGLEAGEPEGAEGTEGSIDDENGEKKDQE